ncbi:hypothetical protein [Sphingomonas xinjiangensis]|uniref:Uncharacterized protein n=1 Tax=Sphingomonas xinjiangensis TaxID=643568 RepID=A0A840YIX6_9SPHN|nr:hypothetical protein [Sphingomonas xinjiangensis]MBB5712059.1 hypothetical protein [Sphingomonas xinjiangensis]
MTYGFKRPSRGDGAGGNPEAQKLDLGGFRRNPVEVSPEQEAAAVARGDAIGFVDRSQGEHGSLRVQQGRGVRRRKDAVPSRSLYIKGPEELLDWFIELTNERGYRSYWQALEEFRELLADRTN